MRLRVISVHLLVEIMPCDKRKWNDLAGTYMEDPQELVRHG